MFDEDTLSGSGDDTLTGGPTGNIDPAVEEEGDNTGGTTQTGGPSSIAPVVDEEEDDTGDDQKTDIVTVYEGDSILNPEYVEKVKQSQFGELYNRLVSDEQESQCAEFLAPQLIKQDRLYNHTFNAAFGQFY